MSNYDDVNIDFTYRNNTTIHNLFELQVLKTPNSVAIVHNNRHVTYSLINHKANQFAHFLRKKNIKKEDIVAISVERSVEMVIGLLAILKAGGAYIPVDPNYPQSRLDYILKDVKACTLIVNNNTKHKFPNFHGELICINEQKGCIELESCDNPTHINVTDDLAYIIYTSGSTGKPKGIYATHASSINRFNWMWRQYPFNKKDVFCQKTSFNFVDFVWELFGPLLKGIKSVIIDNNTLNNHDLLLYVIDKFNISHLILVPSFIKQLVLSNNLHILNGLKQLNISGEKLDAVLKKALLKTNIKTILNLYGSSEVAGDVTFFDLRTLNYLDSNKSIIGKPIDNTQIYILNKKMHSVGTDVIGEIYVAGASLARGYLNNDVTNDKKFIPNIFTNDNSRLYKTGDLGRYLQDGNIEFISRSDNQIKIRGHRIEPAEIEDCLQDNNNIVDCVALSRDNILGNIVNQDLIIYVVPKNQEFFYIDRSLQSISASDFYILRVIDPEYQELFIKKLEKSFTNRLPDFMIPDFYVCLNKLPLNINGKLDRNALLQIREFSRFTSTNYVSPSNTTQEVLKDIIAKILKIQTISINEDLVKLSGYSLLAMQIISRVRKHFNIEITIKDLYKNRTILQLSSLIDDIKKSYKSFTIFNIPRIAKTEQIPLSPSQERLWLAEQILPNTSLYNVNTIFKINGPLDINNLSLAINKVIGRHEVLRTIFTEKNGEPNQEVLPNLRIFLERETLLDTYKSLVKKKILAEINRPFNFTKGPLIRVKLFEVHHQIYLFSITVHHIIFDPWSMDILLKEISYYYNQFYLKTNLNLETLQIQYGDFSIWCRKYHIQTALKELEYWQHKLSGIQPLELSIKKSKLNNQSLHGLCYKHFFLKQVREDLITIAQTQNTSLFIVLMSVLFVLLHKYSNQDDIVIGSPISNRNLKELEDLIGYFVNIIVFRVKFGKKDTFQNIITNLTLDITEIYKNQNMDIQKLLNILNIDRRSKKNSLFQTMFTYEEVKNKNIVMSSDLKIEKYDINYRPTAFDLTFHIYDNGEGFELEIVYINKLFNTSSIKGIMMYFNKIIKEIILNPNILIRDL